MFTGLVETVGEVVSFTEGRLVVKAAIPASDPVTLGESIAVNGCCLTAIEFDPNLVFELSPETLARTSFGSVQVGHRVNLERAMRANGRFGGHIVQGHVDGVGSYVLSAPEGEFVRMRFRVSAGGGRYLIDKGSIAIEGISLTVVEPKGDEFDVWVIPHTLANTNLGQLQSGNPVNIEYDVLAKYVESLLAKRV